MEHGEVSADDGPEHQPANKLPSEEKIFAGLKPQLEELAHKYANGEHITDDILDDLAFELLESNKEFQDNKSALHHPVAGKTEHADEVVAPRQRELLAEYRLKIIHAIENVDDIGHEAA